MNNKIDSEETTMAMKISGEKSGEPLFYLEAERPIAV
jgi:hypothetical protein